MSADVSPPRQPDAAAAGLGRSGEAAIFQAVFGQSPLGAGIFDTDCRYVHANAALQRIIGLSLPELVGRRINDVLGSLGEAAAANLRQVMASGEPLVNQELTGVTPAEDGTERSFLVSYFSLADAGGQVVGAASVVSDVSEQRQVRDELAAANDRLRLLSRVSAVLAASLDITRTLENFAAAVVPAFADHCIIDLLDDDDPSVIRRVVLMHATGLAPEAEAWTRPGRTVSYPPRHPASIALRTGRAMLDQPPPDHDFRTVAPTPQSAAYAQAVGIRSAMTAPLVARGTVLGVVSFVTSASGRVYGEADTDVAEDLAARAAVAIDNARLYGREKRTALTLQRNLLPQRLPCTPGLLLAATYRPAAHDDSVGGDWYDVIPLPCGRVAIVMGDVMGRGLPAAALMGQLRAAVRAYAAQDLPPAEVLRHLDEVVRGLAEFTLVTCVYAVYDPVEESLCIANAGHPPPLVISAGGGVTRLDDHGSVLGAGHARYGQSEVALRAGDRLVLYTDGLVERRDEDLDIRIDALGRWLRDEPGALQEQCERAVDVLGPEPGHEDDVALMLVQPLSAPRPRVARLDVVPHVGRVAQMRAFAAGVLEEWGDTGELTELVTLLVSELVTNVVTHATGHLASLRLERHVDRIVLAVVDADPAPPRVEPADVEAESGRGLRLVEALAHRWGSRPVAPRGKVVWAEVLAPGPAVDAAGPAADRA